MSRPPLAPRRAYERDYLSARADGHTGAGFAAGPVSEGGGSGTDFYYSDRWQVIEDRVVGEAVLEGSQYVWSQRYIDAMVLRDRDVNYDDTDGREERLYVQQDASFNTTALVDTEGAVVGDACRVSGRLHATRGGGLGCRLHADRGSQINCFSRSRVSMRPWSFCANSR